MVGKVRIHFPSRTERGGENVALGMRLSILGADDAALDQAPNIRMITGEAGDAVFANQINSAITDVGEVELRTDDCDGGAGGAHAVKFRVLGGEELNLLVSGDKGGDERLLGIAGEVAIVDITDGLDGKAAGFLPAFVSAHAIGDDGQAAFAAKVGVRGGLPVSERVFIVGADAADVGQISQFDPRSHVDAFHGHIRFVQRADEASSRRGAAPSVGIGERVGYHFRAVGDTEFVDCSRNEN